MSERIKTVAALVSLGLFLLAVAGCARSFLPPTMRVRSEKGKLQVFCIFTEEKHFEARAEGYSGGEDSILSSMRDYPHIERSFLGFGYMSGTYNAPYRVFSAPYWFILIVTGAFPAAWWVKRRRVRARRREGRCLRCGYDLRATPGKCPECGWAG